jgi:hypothetical protein
VRGGDVDGGGDDSVGLVVAGDRGGDGLVAGDREGDVDVDVDVDVDADVNVDADADVKYVSGIAL